jgi:uncharacterized protein (TIGR02265 family)
MFFQRILDAARRAGVDLDAAGLGSRPANYRYTTFFDYPVADYFRLVGATAKAMYPREALSEGIRRVAGADFAKFADSKVGGVMLAFTGDAVSTLAKGGTMYATLLKGTAKIQGHRTADGVRLEYRGFPALVETYPIGTVESTLRHYGVDYEIEIDVLGPKSADYTVRVR